MTIVESMIASALLAIGIASLTNVSAATARLQQAGRLKSAALRALDTRIAMVQSTAFANLQGLDGTGFDVADVVGGVTLSTVPGDDDGDVGAIRVTAPTGDASRLLEVEITVAWQGGNGPCTLVRRVRRSRIGG